jgi:pimeloyl-ACP methyl ester carboxylesterase
VNGIQWHYVDEWASEGTVILFLQGLPEGWYSSHYVPPWVDHKYRLIAIDIKGYRRSDLQDGDYSWHHVAQEMGACTGMPPPTRIIAAHPVGKTGFWFMAP